MEGYSLPRLSAHILKINLKLSVMLSACPRAAGEAQHLLLHF
jgi:hypothetical protein